MTFILVCNPRRPEGVPQAERFVPPASELMPDLRTLLRVAPVEADDGLVRAPRAIVLTEAFTSTLNAAIRAQAGPDLSIPCPPRGRSPGPTRNRLRINADHDFKPEATSTPFGRFAPQTDDRWLSMACSRSTSDFLAGRLEQWWQEVRLRFLGVKAPVIDRDNGPVDQLPNQQICHRLENFSKENLNAP